MTVPLESLPLGFRFHPTDEELVNHYLKRKINGRIKSEAEVIPEIDVCKCEPWDLPGKSLIRSDDPEWFFFAPKDRKYANGHRSNRATEKGYWKATGKDRIIRAKKAPTGSKKHKPHKPPVIGMKKTLVFHRGRAPKGVRTRWIMHEYRTTEPEFDSGEQGGYVLYRLFKKEEDKAPSSNVEDVETTGLSPTPCESSPVDAQHEAEGMGEISTLFYQESPPPFLLEDLQSLEQPAEIKRCLDDKPESSMAYHPGEANTGEAGETETDDSLQDLFARLDDNLPYEQIDPNGFPRISSPMLPYTDHPFFDNINPGSPMGYFDLDNNHGDSINDVRNSVLINSDERPSPWSNIRTEFNLLELHDGTVHSSWCRDSATSSDSDVGLAQGTPGLDAPDRSRGSARVPNPPPPLPPRLPHISSPTYSTISAAESLHDSSNAIEESSAQNSATSNGDNLDETGIMIRVRPLMDSTFALEQQGTATRRLRLETTTRNASYVGTDSETSTTKDDFGDDASIISNDGIECGTSDSEVEEDADDNIPESNDVLDPNVVDKLEESSVHDDKSQPGSVHQDARGMLRLRTKQSKNNEGIKKNPLCATRNPRIGSVNYIFWSVLRAIFLLLRLVIFLLLCLVVSKLLFS